MFSLLATIEHARLVEDLKRLPSRHTIIWWLYVAASVLSFIIAGWVLYAGSRQHSASFGQFSFGILLTFLILLPLHEHVHAAAYRYYGSTSVKVIYHLRRMTAYCVADRFVIDGRRFIFVCAAPFLVITAVLLIGLALSPAWKGLMAGMLLMHTAACSGDFMLADFTWFHRTAPLYTWDDCEAGVTYFYAQTIPHPDELSAPMSIDSHSTRGESGTEPDKEQRQ